MNAWEAVAVALRANVPILLNGPPGVGKTARIREMAERLGLPIETIIASTREPADFALPVLSEDRTAVVRAICAPLRRLAEAGKGLLFLDELSSAPPATSAALLQLVCERRLEDFLLPPGVRVIAAMNPTEQAAGGWDLSPAMANRWVHVRVGADVDEWASWAVTQGRPVLALMTAFLRSRPFLLCAVPKEEAAAAGAWPSPRSWDAAARLLEAAPGAEPDLEFLLVSGCVGEAATIEFLAWRKELDLPDPEVLLADPTTFKRAARGDQQYATLASVVSAALRDLTPRRWTAAWRVLAAAAGAGIVDVAAASARALALARRPDLPLPVQEVKPFLPLLASMEAKS